LNRSFFARLLASANSAPFHFTAISSSAAGIKISGNGGTPGIAVLESSADLKAWNPLQNPSLSGADDTATAPRKFYRLRQP